MAIVATTKRQYGLGIWALALGYFISYTPYSGLSKAVTSGLLTGGRSIPGTVILPAAAISTALAVLLFITVKGWWKYGRKRWVLGLNLPFPRVQAFVSGIGFATIILTTTLAYSFSGVSIILALVLMRSGVLTMSPVIDWVFQRRVRWFSWAGLILSLTAILISLSNVQGYHLSLAALLNLGAYLAGHTMRIPSMTKIAKTGDREVAFNYFVEEQVVAMPAIVLALAVLAFLGPGDLAGQLRFGFAHLFDSSFAPFGWAIGLCYAALGIFLSFLYLDRRENTFCMPLFACSSLLAGIAASYLLVWLARAPAPNGVQLSAAILLIAALLVMSPLHHMPLYIKQLREAIAENRLKIVTLVGSEAGAVANISQPVAASFITINFNPVREVVRKRSPNLR
jgi:hypothetical protein